MNSRDNKATYMDALLCALEGKDPSKAIENQEKRGQQAVIENQRLPKKTNGYSVPVEFKLAGVDECMSFKEQGMIVKKNIIEFTRQQYDKMGITVIDDYDDLFWNVRLPEGWKLEATEHTMWNKLFDDQGKERATFFYKAALYDRSAFINFNTRFQLSVKHIDESGDFKTWSASDFQGHVKDGDIVIFSTECITPTGNYIKDNKIEIALREKLEDYMKENYPEYEDINAYWNS